MLSSFVARSRRETSQVMARVGAAKGGPDGYCAGIVLKTWDQGNCYRIELQDDNKTNVWGPVDEDACVRAPA